MKILVIEDDERFRNDQVNAFKKAFGKKLFIKDYENLFDAKDEIGNQFDYIFLDLQGILPVACFNMGTSVSTWSSNIMGCFERWSAAVVFIHCLVRSFAKEAVEDIKQEIEERGVVCIVLETDLARSQEYEEWIDYVRKFEGE